MFGNPIRVYPPGFLIRFFCESGDVAVRIQPLFAIGSMIPAQRFGFLNTLFQLSIHPGDISLQSFLIGQAYVSALFRGLQKASWRFD